MFADSLLETSWTHPSRRGWVTITSFVAQAVIAGLLLLIPMFQNIALPRMRQLSPPVSMAPPPGPPPPVSAHPQPSANSASNLSGHALMEPPRIPHTIQILAEEAVGPAMGQSGTYVIGSTGPGGPEGVLNSIGMGARPLVPSPPPVAHIVQISHMKEGDLIRKVQPEYPALARMARIQGAVLLQAIISKQGSIENLQVISGPPMLVRTALDAVRQWRYRPYVLNGEPVEVETQITVNFALSGG